MFRMLLVLSEDHKEHLAFLTKVDAAGKSFTGMTDEQNRDSMLAVATGQFPIC